MVLRVYIFALLSCVLFLLNSCSFDSAGQHENEYQINKSVTFDLDQIRQRGKLILLTQNTSTSYYLYRGRPFGYDYELIKDFASEIGVQLEVQVIPNLEDMFDMLNSGQGDLIACNLTVTNARKDLVAFTKPLMDTRQVLVQRKTDGWQFKKKKIWESELVREPGQLRNKKVFVHRISSFYQRLLNIEGEAGIDIDIVEASGEIDTEKLIELVAHGDIDYTVADENMALLNQTYHPNLDVETSLSLAQDVAWATRKNAPELLHELNAWLYNRQNKSKLAFTYKKYFLLAKSQKDRVVSEYSSIYGRRLSDYDEVLKEHSRYLGWDWRLLASMVFQESRFDPDAKSWAGAFGLMQLMPHTALRFGIDTTQKEVANIEAGVRFLVFLDNFWTKYVTDEKERVKFVLASYNVGPGHVLDAQIIAEQLHMDPHKWDDNVAECLLRKSKPQYYQREDVKHGYCRGEEPYEYVRKILARYQEYLSMNL